MKKIIFVNKDKSNVEHFVNKKKRVEFPVTICKAYVEDGKHYVEAIASDTGLDYYWEKMSEKNIDSMALQCTEKNILILPTHWDTFEIGKTVKGEKIDGADNPFAVDKENKLKALKVKIELNMDYPQSKVLFKEVESGECTKQLSVGGYLNPENKDAAYWEEVEYEYEVEGQKKTRSTWVLVLDDLILDHIAITRANQAANERTGFMEAIAKSLKCEFDDRWQVIKTFEDDGLKRKYLKNKEVLTLSITEEQAKELEQAGNSLIEKFKSIFKSNKPNQESEKEEKTQKDNPTIEFDVVKFKEEFMTEINKSIDAKNSEIIKSISESFSNSITKCFETFFEANIVPLNEQLKSIAENTIETKSIQGQDEGTEVNKNKENEDDVDFTGTLFKGINIPSIKKS